MDFLFVFKISFEEKGGEILGDQKFILARQLAPVLKR